MRVNKIVEFLGGMKDMDMFYDVRLKTHKIMETTFFSPLDMKSYLAFF
jgi:hypothetical protein